MPRLDLAFSRGSTIEQAADFNFVDDATPLGVDDTSGSVGSMTVTVDKHRSRAATMKALVGQDVVLSSAASEARAIGRVTHVSGTDSSSTIDIDSIALRLAVRRAAKPYVGTLAGAITYWVGLCSIAAGNVSVDAAIANQGVNLVGFRDNVWLRIKQLCAATKIEVVIQDNLVVVRKPRAVFVTTDRLSARSWDMDDTSLAQTIEVEFYDPRNVVSGDYTADYSRSNVSADVADDPSGGLLAADAPSAILPPGYKKVSVLR